MIRMAQDDSELVDLARSGDSDAFRELVIRHSQRIFATAYRITGREEDADDVVQETFLRAFRKLHLFDGRAQFSTWLHRIAVNCSMDSIRKVSRREARETPDELVGEHRLVATEPGPDRLAASSEWGREVEKVLRSLTPTERTVFVLRHFEGYTSKEIGQMMGMRSGAIRNAVFRAVQKMRASLAPRMKECHETSNR